MSLNNVVNNLVRAAAGIPSDITDIELDTYVAKLLAEEAKSKEKNWSELGLSGLLKDGRDSPDPNAPKPNKRFLASVIRTVDGHNSALLRAQAEAARDVRVQRGERSRSGAGPSRLFGGALQDMSRDGGDRSRRRRSPDDDRSDRSGRVDRDRRSDRDRGERTDREGRDEEVYHHRKEREEGSKRRYDTRDELDRSGRSRHRHRVDFEEGDNRDHVYRKRSSRALDEEEYHNHRSRDRALRKTEEFDEEEYFNDSSRRASREEDERYKRIREEQKGRDTYKSFKSRDKDSDDEVDRAWRRERRKKREAEEDELRQQKRKDDRAEIASEPDTTKERSQKKTKKADSPSPVLGGSPISRMDKYFTQEYDPRLDLSEVPKDGIVAEVGWDNMLAILKERGQKRRHHSPGLSDDGYAVPRNAKIRPDSPELSLKQLEKAERRKKREDRKKRRGGSSDEDELDRDKRKGNNGAMVSAAASSGDGGLFDIPYVKKGGVREWDVGK